jgi:hypothetical protein
VPRSCTGQEPRLVRHYRLGCPIRRSLVDTVSRLVSVFGPADGTTPIHLALLSFRNALATSSGGGVDKVRIHVEYFGQRAEGTYDPETSLIDIVSGPAPKATGLKPSPAAREVIRAVNETRGVTGTASRNGWGFWKVDATGRPLQSLRQKPAAKRSRGESST